MKNAWFKLGALSALLWLAACSTPAVTADEYSKPRERMAAARQAGAPTLGGDAALHLQLAEENFEKGEKLMKEEDNNRARYFLAMAKADATVALALAKQDGLRKKVEELNERIANVRSKSL